MYGGKHIATGDTIFVFASEHEGRNGLIASGVVTSAEAIAQKRGIVRHYAAREHHDQAHRGREAAPMERRSTRN